MPPVRNVASELSTDELALLREAIDRHVPDLVFLLTDQGHQLTLEESDRLVDALAEEISLDAEGYIDDRGIAVDSLLGRVNLGPFMR